jgi:predicted nucleic acid-binding Zn ribbon protein
MTTAQTHAQASTQASAQASSCRSCGATTAGKFCSACGAPREAAACAGCGAAIAGSVRFCSSCGRSLAQSGGRSRDERTPWLVAGAALAGLLAVLLVLLSRDAGPAVAASAVATAARAPVEEPGAPPDISNLSSRERFDRLYNRVMQAEQSGDDATVARFTPMALLAFAQLDTLDADARYHAALLQVHAGDVAGPAAQADTILRQNPGHLFGYMIRGTLARWTRDDRAMAEAYAGFLEHVDAELAAGRPEYEEHRTSIDQFGRAAAAAGGRRAGS